MDDVRLVFTASRTWFGRLIRKLTRSQVSHVFVEFPVWDRRMAGEATVGGTRMVLADKARHNVVVEYRCTFPARSGLIGIARKLGTPYDYLGLFMAFFHILWTRLKLCLAVPRWSTSAIKCSELAVIFIRECGLKDVRYLEDEERASPDDVRMFCTSHAHLFERIYVFNKKV